MSTLVRLLMLVLLFGSFTSAFAVPTTPDSDFIDNGNATVTHKITGLTWKRCAEGQVWDGKTCTGEPAFYTYAQTLKLISNFAGNSDWRMPNVAELNSLLERERINPAINTTFFPNTLGAAFWTSSPIVQAADGFVWGVTFGDGGHIFWGTPSEGYQVRLVRGRSLQGESGEYTPTNTFTDLFNGTVTHKTTGLMWQRCAVGQSWDGKACSGSVSRYSYDEALKLTSNLGGAHRLAFADFYRVIEYCGI